MRMSIPMLRQDADSPTAAEIAASVKPPAALAMLDRRLAGLRKSRDELDHLLAVIYSGPVSKQGPIADTRIRKKRIEDELVTVRREASAMRAAHEASVRAALAPMQGEAAAKFGEAYSQLLEAWKVLDEIAGEIARVATVNSARRAKVTEFQTIAGRLVASAAP
jgi:hypothetical protein